MDSSPGMDSYSLISDAKLKEGVSDQHCPTEEIATPDMEEYDDLDNEGEEIEDLSYQSEVHYTAQVWGICVLFH